MTSDTNIILKASVDVFGLDADIDIQLAGGPTSIRLAPAHPVDFKKLWDDISSAIDDIAGFGLPDLGAWSALFRVPGYIVPSLYLSPSGSDEGGLAAYLSLEFLSPLSVGGEIDIGGGVTVSITPNFDVHAIFIGYESGGEKGLDVRARVTTKTKGNAGSPGLPKSQIVSYPFPVPSQDSKGTFRLHYIGLGQRVGPTVQVTATDPMEAIFDQMESELAADDPTTVLTNLAKDFYQPDRDWFVAADVEMKGFRIRAILNDPAMYGLEITVANDSPSPFAGLLFEILYQKLGPNLGMYYGALTLPTLMRRIPLEGFILILPGFKIWVYTNGDFRINVGWPMGTDSIGISMDLLIGRAGFYFAKLRSGDDPGANAGVDYDPILAFGIGVSLSAELAYNAGIFSARLDISVGATFQGLLAWDAGKEISKPPDHYWFAGTAHLSLLIEGTVDFAIIKASVLISFTANAGVAFETGYSSLIEVHASVKVEVSVKVIFFTIHLSFHASVGTQFTIGSGPHASVNGPLAPGLSIPGGYGTGELIELERRIDKAEELLALQEPPLMSALRTAEPVDILDAHSRAASVNPVPIDLNFVLQPTAIYDGSDRFALIASLLMDCPPPGVISPSRVDDTSFGRLLAALVEWLLAPIQGTKLSDKLSQLQILLGQGSEPPFGSWPVFDKTIRTYLSQAISIRIAGVALGQGTQQAEQTVAMMPMLDCLELSYTDMGGQKQTVDFSTFNETPENYAHAVNLYFEDVGFDGSAPAQAKFRQLAQSGSPQSGPSVAAFVQTDYFLMLARNAVNQLLPAALEYENDQKNGLTKGLGDPNSGEDTLDFALTYARAMATTTELDTLFETFDFGSAAGIGSRFLIGGLQLPDPKAVPAYPTRENMKQVETDPFFVLTGQQYDAKPAELNSASLSMSANAINPPKIDFKPGSPATSTTASFDLPAVVPAVPDPSWSGITSPSSGSAGSLDVTAMKGVAGQQMFATLKQKTVWDSETGTSTILALGPQILARLANEPIQMAVSVEAPPKSNADPKASSPWVAIDTTPSLVIPIRISQLPANGFTNAAGMPSPPAGSPNPAKTAAYLPHLYQITGTDEATRDLIFQALQGDLTGMGAEISLLYPKSKKDGDQTKTLLMSETLAPDVSLVKTNLSTLNEAPQVGGFFAMMASQINSKEHDRATIGDVAGFLRLIWEVSVVNSQGFFLYYANEHGDDLPSDIFSSAGNDGGGLAEFTVLVRFSGSKSTQASYPQFATAAVVEEPDVKDTLYAECFDDSGNPLQVFSTTYPAGDIALSVIWDRPVESPEPVVPVGELYHMLQYQVAANGYYDKTVWSLPIGPSSDNLPESIRPNIGDDSWQYVESIPAHLFRIGGSPNANRYDIIDTEIEVDLRIIDVFGNVLPGKHSITHTELYHDSIVSLSEWPGLLANYRILPGRSGQAVLELDLDFDPDAIVPKHGDSPGLDLNARTAWTAAGRRYELICEQLAAPGVSVTLGCSLTGSDSLGGNPEQEILSFATNVREAIVQGLAQAQSPDVPVVSPVIATITANIPISAPVTLSSDIFPLSATVTTERDPNLVSAAARENMPQSVSVCFDVPADLRNDSSPTGSAGLTQFAQPFEDAFQNYDGKGGCLKLAERAGVHSTNEGSEVHTVWVTRWGKGGGIDVDFKDDLVHFALAPLNTTPMNHTNTVDGTATEVDLDQWADTFLRDFDSFVAPEMAAAIAVLDSRNATNFYNEIMQVKSDLANTVPKGVTWLFDQQNGLGDREAAVERLSQAMLAQLSTAFEVTTISQIPAHVGQIVGSPPDSPQIAPQLYGRVGPPDARKGGGQVSPTIRPPAYTMSNGELKLTEGDSWMSILVTATNPSDQVKFDLSLEYQVSYIQHDFEPGEEYLGYVPSSWLKFVIPDTAPLSIPVTPVGKTVDFPVPLIFEPPIPTLVDQTARGADIASPPSGASPGEIISQALEWFYSVDLGLDLSAQDQLFTDITYNRTDNLGAVHMLASSEQALQGLLDALADFRAWYAEARSQFGLIPATAYPLRKGEKPANPTSPDEVQDFISNFATLANGVADAWAAIFEPINAMGMVTEDIITDHYWLSVSPGDDEMKLARRVTENAAQTSPGGDPVAEMPLWPEIMTGDGQSWLPPEDVTSPGAHGFPPLQSPDAWETISHDFPGSPSSATDFSALSLKFGPHSILHRQTATSSVFVRRNADILDGLTTSRDFIYISQTAEFKNSIVPLIQQPNPIIIPPGLSFAETMAEIIEPLAAPSAALNPVLRIAAQYQFTIATDGSNRVLPSQNAVRFFQNDSFRASPATAGDDIAGSVNDWVNEISPTKAGGKIVMAFTVFGTIKKQQLPLIQLDQVEIDVSGVDPTWWTKRVGG